MYVAAAGVAALLLWWFPPTHPAHHTLKLAVLCYFTTLYLHVGTRALVWVYRNTEEIARHPAKVTAAMMFARALWLRR